MQQKEIIKIQILFSKDIVLYLIVLPNFQHAPTRDNPSIDLFMLVLITMVHLLQKVEISAVSSFVDSFAL